MTTTSTTTTTTTTTKNKSQDGNEGTCVPGWTLPLLWEPPAVRRRKEKKGGTHVLDVLTEERTETERETPTVLPTFLLLFVLPLFLIPRKVIARPEMC